MPDEDFYTPTDTDALRMENELLSFEVRFLRAQIEQTERLKARVTECEHRLEKERKRSEQAEKDLFLLVRRLMNSPLGWFLRYRRSFQTLENRYVRNSEF